MSKVAIKTTGVSSPLMVNSLVVLILIYVGRVQEVIPGLSDISLGKVAVLGVLFLYIFSDKTRTEEGTIWNYPATKYLIYISILAVFSIPGSDWPKESFDFVFLKYPKVLIFIYLIAMIAKSKKDLERLCWGLVWSAIILAAGTLISPVLETDRFSTSSTYDSNDLALILVIALPMMYYMMLDSIGRNRWILLGGLGLIACVIPMTGSRGGILAFITVVIAILLKHGLQRAFLLVPVFLLGIYLVFSGSPHLDRYLGIGNLGEDYNMDSRDGRIEIWKRTSILILTNPVFGSGIAAFPITEGKTHSGGKWSSAHNSFIEIGVELGVGGLILHLWIISSMIKQWRKEGSNLGKGLEVSLYAYCVGGFFLSWAYAYAFYFFLAISIVGARLQEMKGDISNNTNKPQSANLRQ